MFGDVPFGLLTEVWEGLLAVDKVKERLLVVYRRRLAIGKQQLAIGFGPLAIGDW